MNEQHNRRRKSEFAKTANKRIQANYKESKPPVIYSRFQQCFDQRTIAKSGHP